MASIQYELVLTGEFAHFFTTDSFGGLTPNGGWENLPEEVTSYSYIHKRRWRS